MAWHPPKPAVRRHQPAMVQPVYLGICIALIAFSAAFGASFPLNLGLFIAGFRTCVSGILILRTAVNGGRTPI